MGFPFLCKLVGLYKGRKNSDWGSGVSEQEGISSLVGAIILLVELLEANKQITRETPT